MSKSRKKKRKSAKPSQPVPSRPAPYQRNALWLGLLGGLFCYLAQPPVGWGPLAWIGPVPWIVLARLEKLPGKRPYRALWLAGAIYWLATLQWLRLAHPSMHLALALLAAYLGVYLPVFVGLTRVAYHRLGMPLWRSAPIVWTGLELIRAHFLTGFMMGSLAHTQVKTPTLLQIADLFGEYGVTFLIVLVAACVAQALPLGTPENDEAAKAQVATSLRKLAPGIVALILAIGYGSWQLGTTVKRSDNWQNIALIQGDTLGVWKSDAERLRKIMREHVRLSEQAILQAQGEGSEVDLVIWPETMFREPLITIEEDYEPPAEVLVVSKEEFLSRKMEKLTSLARKWHAGFLTGIDRVHLRHAEDVAETAKPLERVEQQEFNSAVFVDRQGEILGAYDKMHRVPYGEYTPFSSWFPYPAGFTPLTGGIVAGSGPKSFDFEGIRYSPSICYEKAVPHLMRRQIATLGERGELPDVLVNLTNDAWYWGSAELDMHLACGILRSVELRTPMLIAANRGLSAHIDAAGNVLRKSVRDWPAILMTTESARRNRDVVYPSLYARWGDWLPAACLVCCMVFAAVGWLKRGAPVAPGEA